MFRNLCSIPWRLNSSACFGGEDCRGINHNLKNKPGGRNQTEIVRDQVNLVREVLFGAVLQVDHNLFNRRRHLVGVGHVTGKNVNHVLQVAHL